MRAALICVAETATFQRQARDVRSEAERFAFLDFIAGDPECGDLVSETGGIRKVR